MGIKLDYLLIDAAEEARGLLACTDVTEEGFLFDLGGEHIKLRNINTHQHEHQKKHQHLH